MLLYKAPDHRARAMVSAPLDEELRKTYRTRSLPLREGDTVLITRGDFKGISGRVLKVDRRARRVEVEGLTRERADGRTVRIGIHPSKTLITRLNLDDKWRMKALERRSGASKPPKGIGKEPREVKV